MSQARMSRLWKLTESIRDLFRAGGNLRRKPREMKPRHLQLDSLEERTLLSLTIGSTQDVLVNPEWQDIRGEVSVAINSSNDVVAAWTAADQMTDPVTGETLGEDLNIYARYLTDEVQIVTIPVETALIGKGSSFQLVYGSAAVQRLSFYTATVPNSSSSTAWIDGTLMLSVNGGPTVAFAYSEKLTPLQNADALQKTIRSLGADYSEVEVVAYTERDFDITWYGSKFAGTVPTLKIEAQDFPTDTTDPTKNFVVGALVETVSSPMLITGYNLQSGENIGIAVTSNATQMANNIKQAFNSQYSTDYYAPIQRNWTFDEETRTYTFFSAETAPFRADTQYEYSITRVFPKIEVDVQALDVVVQDELVDLYDADGNYIGQETRNVSYYQFQITFTGNSGYTNHQELALSSMKAGGVEKIKDNTYNSYISSFTSEGYVETIKESSDVFRVNDPEPASYIYGADGSLEYDIYGDPILTGSGKTNQYRPQVAFDDSGNFTVVWESEVNDLYNSYNSTDIYARRFTIQGVVDTDIAGHLPLTFYADGGKFDGKSADYVPLANTDPYLPDVESVKQVQGVRPLAEQFLVNVETNGKQEKPSISCDGVGNFAITWTTDSQWNDYYAGILARWFDKTGLAITDDIEVISQLNGTPNYGESYVKMGPDGTTVIVWQQNDNLYKSVYAPDKYENPFVEKAQVATNAYAPSIDFDANGRYVLAWTEANGSYTTLFGSDVFSTVAAELFLIQSTADQVYEETSLGSGPVSDVDTGWPTEQYLLCVGSVSVGMDADGDIFFAYQGYGFDMQEVDTDKNDETNYTGSTGNVVALTWDEIYQVLVETGNTDLETYFIGWFTDGSIYSQSNYTVDNGYGVGVDVDTYIAACLSSAQRKIRDDIYSEYYADYFNEIEAYINARYAEREKEFDSIYAEIERVIADWYHGYLNGKTYSDYANDTVGKVTNPNSDWYGKSFAEIVANLASEHGEAYAKMFEKVLRQSLSDYYMTEKYDELYEEWYAALCHFYSGDELEEKIQEKITETIEISVDQYIDVFNQRMASTGLTPKEVLDALISEDLMPPIDSDAVAVQTQIELTEWIRLYMIEIEIDEALYRSADAIYMRTLGYSENWYNVIDTWVQGRAEWSATIDNLVYNEETQKYELGPDAIFGIDDLVKSDLTSTYQERYDQLVKEKLDSIYQELEAIRTYDYYDSCDTPVAWPDSPYFGETYAEICARLTEEQRAQILQPGTVEYDEIRDEIYSEVYDELYADLYAKYYSKLQPQYTVNGVVNRPALAAAAREAAEADVIAETDRRMAQVIFEDYLIGDETGGLWLVAEERYGEEVLEALRELPDATLREMYETLIRPDYEYVGLDEKTYVMESALNKEVALAPILKIIKLLYDDSITKIAETLAEEEVLNAIKVQVREDYFDLAESSIRYNYETNLGKLNDLELRTAYTAFLREFPTDDILDPTTGEIDETRLEAKVATALTDDMIVEMTDGYTERDMEKYVQSEVFRSWSDVEDERYYNVLYDYYKEIVTHAMLDTLIKDCSSSTKLAEIQALYREFLLPEFTNDEGDVDEAGLEAAVNPQVKDNDYYYAMFYAVSPEVEERTVEKVNAEIDTKAAMIYDMIFADDAPERLYVTATEWVLEERVRQEILTEVEVRDELYREYYTANLQEALYVYHEADLLDTMPTLVADLYDQYHEYVRYNQEKSLTTAYTSIVKGLMSSLTYMPETYYEFYNAMKDVNLEKLYSEYLEPQFTDTQGNVDEEGLAAAVAACSRDEIIWTFVYRDMMQNACESITDDLTLGLQYDQEESGVYVYNNTDYTREELETVLTAEYNARYFDVYEGMTEEELRPLYRDLMVTKCSAETIGEVDTADKDEMVDALSKAGMEPLYREIIAPLYTNDAGVLNLLEITWAVENATYDEMVETVVEARIQLMTDNIVSIKIDEIAAILTTQAILYKTPSAEKTTMTELLTGICERETQSEYAAAYESQIRQASNLDYFNELRPTVAEEYTDIYTAELLPAYTNSEGVVDWWGLNVAVQEKIDIETQIETDAQIRAEAIAALDDAPIEEEVNARMSSEMNLFGQTVLIDYNDILCTSRKIAPILVENNIRMQSWDLVDAEIERLVNLRVTHDMNIWNDPKATPAEKDAIVDRLGADVRDELITESTQQVKKFFNYEDNATHLETQQGIVYDEVYSSYYKSQADSLYLQYGRELTYCNLATDTEPVFEANEFSPYYGMTYAEICDYLTQNLTGQSATSSASALIESAFTVYYENVVSQTQYISDYRNALETNVYAEGSEKWNEIYQSILVDLKAESESDLYDQYYEEVSEALSELRERETLLSAEYQTDLFAVFDELVARAAELKTQGVDPAVIKTTLISEFGDLVEKACDNNPEIADSIRSVAELLTADDRTKLVELATDAYDAAYDALYMELENYYRPIIEAAVPQVAPNRAEVVERRLKAEVENAISGQLAEVSADAAAADIKEIADTLAHNDEIKTETAQIIDQLMQKFFAETYRTEMNAVNLSNYESYLTDIGDVLAKRADELSTADARAYLADALTLEQYFLDFTAKEYAEMTELRTQYEGLLKASGYTAEEVASAQNALAKLSDAEACSAMSELLALYDRYAATGNFAAEKLVRLRQDYADLYDDYVQLLTDAGYSNADKAVALKAIGKMSRYAATDKMASELTRNDFSINYTKLKYKAMTQLRSNYERLLYDAGYSEADKRAALDVVDTLVAAGQTADAYSIMAEALTEEAANSGFATKKYEYLQMTFSTLRDKYSALLVNAHYLTNDIQKELAVIDDMAETEAIERMAEALTQEDFNAGFMGQKYWYQFDLRTEYEALLVQAGCSSAYRTAVLAEMDGLIADGEESAARDIMAEAMAQGVTFAKEKYEYEKKDISELRYDYNQLLTDVYSDTDKKAALDTVDTLALDGHETQARNIMAEALTLENTYTGFTAKEYANRSRGFVALRSDYSALLTSAGYLPADIAAALAEVDVLNDEGKTDEANQIMAKALTLGNTFAQSKYSFLETLTFAEVRTQYENLLKNSGYTDGDLSKAMTAVDELSKTAARELMAEALTRENYYAGFAGEKYDNINALRIQYASALTAAGYTQNDINAALSTVNAMLPDAANALMAGMLAQEACTSGYIAAQYSYNNALRAKYETILTDAGYSLDYVDAKLAEIDALVSAGKGAEARVIMAKAVTLEQVCSGFTALKAENYGKGFEELYGLYDQVLQAAGFAEVDREMVLQKVTDLYNSGEPEKMRLSMDIMSEACAFETAVPGFVADSYQNWLKDYGDLYQQYQSQLIAAGYTLADLTAAMNQVDEWAADGMTSDEIKERLLAEWDNLINSMSDSNVRDYANRLTEAERAELIEAVVSGREQIRSEYISELTEIWTPILRNQICDGELEGPLADRVAEKISEILATDDAKDKLESRFQDMLKKLSINVRLIGDDAVVYGKEQLEAWYLRKYSETKSYDEIVNEFASEPYDEPIERTAEAMTDLALEAKAKVLTQEAVKKVIDEQVTAKINEVVRELVADKMAEYDELITRYYAARTESEKAEIRDEIDVFLAPVADLLESVGGTDALLNNSIPAVREEVKELMLRMIVVPDAIHQLTLAELAKMESLVLKAKIYKQVYDENYDTVLNEIYSEEYDRIYAEVHDQLVVEYTPIVTQEIYDEMYLAYHDAVDTVVREKYSTQIEAKTAYYNQPAIWWVTRNTLNRTSVYDAYYSEKEAEYIANNMDIVWGVTVGTTAWDAKVAEAVATEVALKGDLDVNDQMPSNWKTFWNRTMGLYEKGTFARGLEVLCCEAADTKSDELVNTYVETLIEQEIRTQINSVNEGGAQPSWVLETNPIPVISVEVEKRIDEEIEGRVNLYAASLVISSGKLDELAKTEYEKQVKLIAYKWVDDDPVYQRVASERLGRMNAVLESVLQYMRGVANDILYTTYNVSGTTTTGDARGVVNAQRDGNNATYYLAVPSVNLGGGTIAFLVNALENNSFNEASISVSLVTDENNKLEVYDTAQAIVNAFIGGGLNIDAGYYDGLAVTVVDTSYDDISSLYAGTYWEWPAAFVNTIENSAYWADSYVVYELTFQGGAHDSAVSLSVDWDNSTLTFSSEEGLSEIVTEISGDEEMSQGLYTALNSIDKSTSISEVSQLLRTYFGTLSADTVTSKLFGEMLDGGVLESRICTLVKDAVVNKGENNFRSALNSLLNEDLVTAQSQPILFSILKYTMQDGRQTIFTKAFDLISLKRQVYEGTELDLPYEDEGSEAWTEEGTGIVHQAREAMSFLIRLEELQTAIDDAPEVDDTELATEYGFASIYTGYRGTPQLNASVGMTDSGGVVVAWQQQSRTSGRRYSSISIESPVQEQSTQIYLREFLETTDYAGARVTSVMLPNGNKIEEGDTVTTATKNLVVSFTENLKTTTSGYDKLHAVDNVDNWSLYLNNVLVEGAIENITFGISKSRSYARGSSDIRINGTDGNPEALSYGTNLWEAVITFKDGYELTSGNYTLVASNMIQDTANNAINSNGYGYSDSSRGNRDGSDFVINFSMLSIDKPLVFGKYTSDEFTELFGAYYSPEHLIENVIENPDSTSQYTTEDMLEDTTGYNANTPNAVASDANGNFVAVWTENTKDDSGAIVSGGIYYKVYRQEYIYNAEGQRILKTIELASGHTVEFELGSDGLYHYYYYDTTQDKMLELTDAYETGATGIAAEGFEIPQQASVAIDDMGRFTVVWDMSAADEITEVYSRDVFATRLSFVLDEAMDPRTGLYFATDIGLNGFLGPYRINVESEYAQQNAAVAMDADGDIVIVWESWKQDGDGWGIYGRRFDDEGGSFGRSNTIQRATFNGTFSPDGNYADITFINEFGKRYEISEVAIYATMSKTVEAVTTAMLNYRDPDTGEYLFKKVDSTTGETVEEYIRVAQQGSNSICIEFCGGPFERQVVSPLIFTIHESNTQKVSATLSVSVSVTATGSYGTEFRINDTTLSHQRFASIGMSTDGTFVVSWTSWGQGQDDPDESNIYAKTFVSNHSLRSTVTVAGTKATTSVNAQVVSSDLASLQNHLATDITEYDGICYVSVGGGEWAGTGALLTSGIHVLTAAHVVAGSDGTAIDPSGVSVTFMTSSGETYTYQAREIYVHTDYQGNVASDTDLAVILLAAEDGVDESISTYDIYRSSDELGRDFTLVGYGDYGTGSDYNTDYLRPTGVKHFGMNTFDLIGTNISDSYNSNTLLYDFDNGYRSGDFFGRNYGVVDYGTGRANEAISAPGDSGGPCFIDGKIAGVISWGSSEYPLFDDYAAAVRVSAYADWIDGIVAGASGGEILVNAGYEEGMQLWSDIEIDNNGNIVVTWTSYNQDGHGDTASGGSSNGLGGIYMRRWMDSSEYSDVELVNDYTGYDQIHSKIDMDDLGNFVITWESYECRTYLSDQPIAFGVYAKRFLNTQSYYDYLLQAFGEDEATEANPNAMGIFSKIPEWMTGSISVEGVGKVAIQTGAIGNEFRVNELTSCDLKRDWLDDQKGVSVAMDSNGDMIFVWTDMNNRSTVDDYDARVMYRTISLTEDDVPPYVTSVTAAYVWDARTQDCDKNISLLGDVKTFREDQGPKALIYTFNELMFTTSFVKQLFKDANLEGEDYLTSPHITTIYDSSDATKRSLLNLSNWTLLKDGTPVDASLIKRIYYGYNAGGGDADHYDYTLTDRNQYELVIEYYKPLETGVYTLTLQEDVTDLANNKLDGDYDGKSGGSFTVKFIVGTSVKDQDDDEDIAFEGKNPEVVSFADGSFIIVSETSGGDDTDIIFRKFGSNGEADSSVTFANFYNAGEQVWPDIAGYDSENYAVVWTGEGEYGEGVYARFYSNGTQVSQEIHINDIYKSFTNKKVTNAQIVYDDSVDAYLVTWLQEDGSNAVVLGRYFKMNGQEVDALGDQFLIACADSSYQSVSTYHISCANGYYGIAWTEHYMSTGTSEVFAKTFKKSSAGWYMNETGGSGRFMVNTTTTGGQNSPRTAINNNGDFFVVWSSTQRYLHKAQDIYTRSFTFNGAAKSSETLVNSIVETNPYDGNHVMPSIAADPDGQGYVITWTSFNSEGINFDLDNRVYCYDNGILACTFDKNGRPVDHETGLAVNTTAEATWLVNSIIVGNQIDSIASMYNWGSTGPEFVIVWEGPYRDYSTVDNETEGEGDTQIGGDDETNVNGNATTTTTTTTGTDEESVSYTLYNAIYYKYYTNRVLSSTTDKVVYNTSSEGTAVKASDSDRMANSASGSNGFYRPTGSDSVTELVSSGTALSETTEAYVMAGTSGDDLFEIELADNGTLRSAKLNGAAVSIPMAVTHVSIIGLTGSDTLVFIGGAGAEAVTVSGETGTISIQAAGFVLSGSGLEDFQLAGGGGGDSLTVNTSNGSDKVTIGLGELTLTSSSRFTVSATGFEDVLARCSNGSASAIMLDTKKNDTLNVSKRSVVMSGEEYRHEVVGFTSVSVSSRYGSDTAVFSDLTFLLATAGSITADTAQMSVSATGFRTVSASGTGSATLIGSKRDDSLTSDSTGAVLTYNSGAKLAVTGFNEISVYGNGGNDTAVLTGGSGQNVLTARSDSTLFTNGTFKRNLSGFSHVTVQRSELSQTSVCKAVIYDSLGSDTIVAEGANASVLVNGREVYQIIAFDQVTAKKEKYSGTDTIRVTGTVDYVLENNGWDTL